MDVGFGLSTMPTCVATLVSRWRRCCTHWRFWCRNTGAIVGDGQNGMAVTLCDGSPDQDTAAVAQGVVGQVTQQHFQQQRVTTDFILISYA